MRKNLFYFTFILMLIMGGQVLATSTTTRQQLEKPAITGTYVYDGQIQIVNLTNFDEALMNVAGRTNINAGTHTVTVSLKNPNSYEWSDGTIDPIKLEWVISKQSISMEVVMADYYYGSKKPVPSLKGDNNTGNVVYYYSTTNSNTGGTLWTDVQDSRSLEPGTYYMYAVVGETTNYYAATTQPVQFNITRISLNAELQSKGSIYNGEWTNDSVEVSITLPSTINELTYVYYKKNGDTNYVPHENTELTGNVITITFDEPINDYLSFVGVNVAGRSITESIEAEIKIEMNAPKVTSINKKVDEDIVRVIANVEDTESGVEYYAITSGEDTISWIELDEVTTVGQISIEIPANEIFYLWIRDAAGNIIEEEKEIVVYRDVSPPEGSIEIVGNEIDGVVYVNNREVTLKLVATDDTTETKDIKMKIYNEEEFLNLTSTNDIAWDTFAEEVPWKLSDGDGLKKLYLILKDSYGNISVSFTEASVEKAEYKVHYYLENIEDENYSEYEVATKIGKVDSQIQLINLRKKITGATYVKTTLSENGAAVTEATIAEDGSTEVYLYYDRNEYTLTLEKDEYVNNVIGAGKYKYGKTVEISAELADEEGYTHNFIEWSSSNKAIVADKTSLTDTLSMPASDITLTAKANKTANEYTVTFNANGGVIRGAGTETITQKVIYGEAYGNIIPTVEQNQFIFECWKTADGTIINNESIVSIAEDHTVYAEWQRAYTLTINPNGAVWGDTLTSEIREYKGASGETVILSDMLPKEDGVKIVLDGNGGTIDGFETYTLLQDVVYVYMYLPSEEKGTYNEETREYTFTNSDASMQVTNYAQITTNDFSTPIREGYTFDSWNTERDGTGFIIELENYFYSEETILYAQWEANVIKVELDANGGRVDPEEIEVTYGEEYGEIPEATREGYAFAGWYTETSDGSKVETTTTVTRAENHTLYAQWQDVTNPKVEVSNITYPANAIIKLTDSESGIRYWGVTNSQTAPISTGTTNATTGNTLNYWYPVANTTAETQVTFTGLNAGTYYAWGKDLTGNQTSVAFIVSKANISPTVNMSGYIYGGTKSTPSVSGNTGNGTVTYYYRTTTGTTGGTAWTSVGHSSSLNAGTYYMYATVGETTNYNGATTAAVAFTIAKANGYVTLSPSSDTITGTGNTDWTDVSSSHGGTLSASSSTSGISTSVNGTRVNISGLSGVSNGSTIRVTVTCAATTNYKEASATYTIYINRPYECACTGCNNTVSSNGSRCSSCSSTDCNTCGECTNCCDGHVDECECCGGDYSTCSCTSRNLCDTCDKCPKHCSCSSSGGSTTTKCSACDGTGDCRDSEYKYSDVDTDCLICADGKCIRNEKIYMCSVCDFLQQVNTYSDCNNDEVLGSTSHTGRCRTCGGDGEI